MADRGANLGCEWIFFSILLAPLVLCVFSWNSFRSSDILSGTSYESAEIHVLKNRIDKLEKKLDEMHRVIVGPNR